MFQAVEKELDDLMIANVCNTFDKRDTLQHL